ncbi:MULTISPECIES: L-threonylcarbamoyladenylate synthase [Dermacoccus]|uniref:Threonylcarbamoyl-AMP synthase n=2 Tax=Dermacoccus TaxID=57495 RepID=A0A417Z6A7_9MICO|nr:L-threonylcarbamoyladenylate synthase [Dermacoccus abyssi]RHW46133.1 threonylcarbamoyl-AMP synthase [Dermacoccus abyssi]
MATFLDIHPENPQPRLIAQVVVALRDGALIAYPTSSGYALGATLGNAEAKERMIRIRKLDAKHDFTLVCRDFAELGQLVQLSNAAFRAVKAATPGPYTFILPATGEVPRKLVHPKKKTVGVRLDTHPVARAIVEALGEPLLSTSLILPDQEEPFTYGWAVKEELDHLVDIVIDAESVEPRPTTVVDFTEGYPEVVRVGSGDTERFEA